MEPWNLEAWDGLSDKPKYHKQVSQAWNGDGTAWVQPSCSETCDRLFFSTSEQFYDSPLYFALYVYIYNYMILYIYMYLSIYLTISV